MPNVNKGGDPEEYQHGFFSRNVLQWDFTKNHHKLEVKAAYLMEDQNYYLKTTTSADSADVVTFIDSENKWQSFELKSNYKTDLKKGFKLTAGFDIGIQRVNSNNYSGIEQRNTYDLYADILKDIRGRLKLNLLVRTEVVDNELLPLMPLFGLNYKLLKHHDFYARASVSRNYHLPSLNDLYWYPGGNSSLKAEEGLETELGLSLVKNLHKQFILKLNADVYASLIDNWIQWVPSDFRYWSPENIAKVLARGFEFSFHISGSMQRFTYKVFAEYSYTKTTDESELAQQDGSSGTQLMYIPLNSANGFIYGTFQGYNISWSLNYIGERETNKKPLPSYLLNNVSVGKRWIKNQFEAELRFKINNLFDVNYQAVKWRAMPGRNFEINMKIKLKKSVR
jgi:iron complex outermembrane receptor protein